MAAPGVGGEAGDRGAGRHRRQHRQRQVGPGAALARRLGGVVVNADSQQLFADLPILTARPTAGGRGSAPHRLYGLLAADEQPSVGRWLALVEPVLAEAAPRGPAGDRRRRDRPLPARAAARHPRDARDPGGAARRAARVGGDGAGRASCMPGLPRATRTWRRACSPAIGSALLRALEVIEATGRSLLAWQAAPRRAAVACRAAWSGVALVPPAAVVNPRIEARLEAMLEAGALGEVARPAGTPSRTRCAADRQGAGPARACRGRRRRGLALSSRVAPIAAQIRRTRSGSAPGSATSCRSLRDRGRGRGSTRR